VDGAVDGACFQHFVLQNHLGASQSNDATRILPTSSRLIAIVVPSVAPNFSKTCSTKTPRV
jgi:hypothetical protein